MYVFADTIKPPPKSNMESSVINFKLNERNEIETADQDEESDEIFDEDDTIVDADTSMSLVAKGNGVMTIRQHTSAAATYICAKCEKAFKTQLGLKRHTNLCRHLPKMKNVTKMPNLKHDVHGVGDDAIMDDKCFCCFEEIGIAHVRFD